MRKAAKGKGLDGVRRFSEDEKEREGERTMR